MPFSEIRLYNQWLARHVLREPRLPNVPVDWIDVISKVMRPALVNEMQTRILVLLLIATGCGDQNAHVSRSPTANSEPLVALASDDEKQIGGASKEQEEEIRKLVNQLVFADSDATNQPVISPGITDDSEEYRERFESCLNAFNKLMEMKGVAFPILIEHLDDKRQSINFRNHYLGNSVGDACYWNIYFQLQDRPRGYSRYGYSRTGRDGQRHPKPYWKGTPFDDAGGLKKWLEKNKHLNYVEMQIKCLQWLLDREKKIGASDADSYFINILPLEIRILERRMENGDDVKNELEHLINIRDNKLVDQIPKELLPEN